MKKKLKLNKETLRYLKDSQLGGVAGGASTAASGCTSCSPSTCATQCCASLTCGCGPNSQGPVYSANNSTCPGYTR